MFKIVAFVMAATFTTLASSQSPPSFDSFFSKFKNATVSADTYQLQDLMAREFDFMGTTNISPSEVFKDLGSGQWANLQSAVRNELFISQVHRGKPARFLRCTPVEVNHNCYVVFQIDSSGQWRWRPW